MNTPAKLAAFTAALAIVFVAALAVGGAVGSDPEPDPATSFRLAATTTAFDPAADATLEFVVTGADGNPLTAYDANHERDLHLIVVRDDLGSYQHVHPTIDGDGTWTTQLDLSAPGRYRAIADFTPTATGEATTLSVDLTVDGEPAAAPELAVSSVTEVDGYEVEIVGDAVAGRESELAFTVRRGGAPVADLQPYLGADGHLVALGVADLDYLHTHPLGDATDGTVRFGTTLPAAGNYRLYLEFRHDDVVHVAPFAITASTGGSSSTTAPNTPDTTEVSHEHDGH